MAAVAHHQRCPQVSRLLGQPLQLGLVRLAEPRGRDEVEGRVAADRKFWKDRDVCALVVRLPGEL